MICQLSERTWHIEHADKEEKMRLIRKMKRSNKKKRTNRNEIRLKQEKESERMKKVGQKVRKLQFLSILHRKFSTDSPHIIEPIDWFSFSLSCSSFFSCSHISWKKERKSGAKWNDNGTPYRLSKIE